jgi:hypothetical protein
MIIDCINSIRNSTIQYVVIMVLNSVCYGRILTNGIVALQTYLWADAHNQDTAICGDDSYCSSCLVNTVVLFCLSISKL